MLVCASLEGLSSFVVNFANNQVSGRGYFTFWLQDMWSSAVAWVLDFGSSRVWLGIARLERVLLLIWNGGWSNVLRSTGQRLECILYRTTVAETRSFWWRDGMLKFPHASPESRPIIRSAFFSMRSSKWSVIVEGLIQHSEAHSIFTLRIWALNTVAWALTELAYNYSSTDANQLV